ncbi:AMIN-like domain-containing (lipo)protein [Streptomyces sp. NPDC054841]
MYYRPRLAALAAGVLLTAGVAATLPASAAPPHSAAPHTALVTNARWGGHGSFDRIVIDVRGTLPPVTVKPVKVLQYDGSGKKVPLAGKYFLEIKLAPAAAHNDAGRSVYNGPQLTRIWLPTLKGLALTGDFEGVVTFGAAFDTKPVYKTAKLHAPERFVIDVRRPSPGCGA